MQPKARMTFRFDGAPPARPEPERQREQARIPNRSEAEPIERKTLETPEPAAGPPTDDYYAWSSPYQDDIRALEEIIRQPAKASAEGNRRRAAESEGHSAREGRPAVREVEEDERGTESRDGRKTEVRGARASMEDGSRSARAGGTKEIEDRGDEETTIAGFGRRAYPAPAERSVREAPSGRMGRTIPFPGARRTDEPDPEEEIDDEGIPELEAEWGAATRYSRQEGPSWWRVIATVVGAIATGGLFGYLLLTLFTGEPLFPSSDPTGGAVPAAALPAGEASAPAATGAGAAGAAGNAGAGASAAKPPAAAETPPGKAGATEAAAAPGAAVYLLQYGVFRTEQSMNEAASQLSGKGLASASDASDGYRVYAGIASSKDEAEALADRLAGMEVYLKPVASPEIRLTGLKQAQSKANFLALGSELYAKIASFTSAALAGSGEDTGVQKIRTAHQLWLEAGKAAGEWEEPLAKAVQNETEQLNAAVSAINKYSDKPSEAHLWNAQSAAMKAALADLAIRSLAGQAG